jgi:hypothetical protein
MTEPRNMHRDQETNTTTAEAEPEVKPEVITDLDLAGDDADVVRGGACVNTLPHIND